MKKINRRFNNFLLYSGWLLYAAVLFALLFTNRSAIRSVNIVPFRSIIGFLSGGILLSRFIVINILGNIAVFIPLGIYLTLFNRDKRIYKNVLSVFLISVSVEIVQYIFKVGVSDIDDVILNCLGGFMGIAVYRILLFKFKDAEKVRYIIGLSSPLCAAASSAAMVIYNG